MTPNKLPQGIFMIPKVSNYCFFEVNLDQCTIRLKKELSNNERRIGKEALKTIVDEYGQKNFRYKDKEIPYEAYKEATGEYTKENGGYIEFTSSEEDEICCVQKNEALIKKNYLASQKSIFKHAS